MSVERPGIAHRVPGTAKNPAIPYVVGFAGIGGVLLALFLKYQRYADLGRTVLEEAHER